MSERQILTQVEDGILTITLNRPEKLNAFTQDMLRQLIEALDEADANDEVRAIIVTGAGRAFCAGADLSSGGNTFNADARADRPSGLRRDGGGVLTLRIFECRKPIIAAVGGLVRSLHAKEELLPEARRIAKDIGDNSAPLAVTLIRQMMWRMLGADHPMEAHKIDSRGIYSLGKGADVKEGVEAFLEKRPAKFKSKVSQDMPDFFPWWEERKFS